MDKETSHRSPSPATTIDLGDEENYRENRRQCLKRETEYYHKLINDGGRPSHPVSLGYDSAKDLEEYREILSYWNPDPNPSDEYSWMVFREQEGRWAEFRESQRRMRTDNPLEAGSVFPPLPAEPGRFAGYCRGLHKRLARHGFQRSFQLNEDPDRQDQLTTWIEYLGFEYVDYDKYANDTKLLQRQYDEAWKALVDAKVLNPPETEESFKYFFFLQLRQEKTDAAKVVESARSTVKAAETELLEAQLADLSERNLSRIGQRLSAARFNMAAATESFEQSSKRYKLIGDFAVRTKSYRIAKHKANRQSILLRWILQQVPLIEHELNLAKVTGNHSLGGDGKRQRSLKRNRADGYDEEPVSKRQRQDSGNHTPLENNTSASPTQKTSSTKQPRQTRGSRTNPSTLPAKSCSHRDPRASKPSNTKSGTEKSGVVSDESARVSKRKRRNKVCLNEAPDPRILRRSSRPKRLPERFQ